MAKPLRKILEEELSFANERVKMYEDQLLDILKGVEALPPAVAEKASYLRDRVGYYSNCAQQMRMEILKEKVTSSG